MAGQDVPIAIVLSAARQCHSRHRLQNPRSGALAGTDRLAPAQSAARPTARQRPRPDAEIVGGEVSEPPLPGGVRRGCDSWENLRNLLKRNGPIWHQLGK